MRFRYIAMLFALAWSTAAAQDAQAVDALPASELTAYQILGVEPADESGGAPSAVLVQDSTTNAPADPAAVEATAVEATAGDATAADDGTASDPAAADATASESGDGTASDAPAAETGTVDETANDPAASDAPAAETGTVDGTANDPEATTDNAADSPAESGADEPASETATEPVTDNAVTADAPPAAEVSAPATEEASATELGAGPAAETEAETAVETTANEPASAETTAAAPSAEPVAEQGQPAAEQGQPAAEQGQPVAEAGSQPDAEADDGTILMAEIMRLLAERDSLYATINELQAENAALAAKASDADYYMTLAATLEEELARLETAIEEKESALAAADARIAEIEAQLIEEGARLAEAEAQIDASAASLEASEEALKKSEAAKAIAEAGQAIAEAALASAKASGGVVPAAAPAPAAPAAPTVAAPSVAPPVAAPVASAPAAPQSSGGYLSGWKLDTARFSKTLRAGFAGSAARIGSWKVDGKTASQTDASQYFSRLELPLAQGKASTLYRFMARSTGKGWVGFGLHLFVEDVQKRRGYGEGKSLLVWFTRDKAARGDEATYLQLYRSDDDVVMERMFDAELADGLEAWRLVEIVYDPNAEYIAVSVDGVLRVVYKTFFGRDSGATVSLRTLGGGGAFSDFSAWAE